MKKVLQTFIIICTPFTAAADTQHKCPIATDQQLPRWVEKYDTCNADIRMFITSRLPGIEHYGPALKLLSQQPHEDQLIIAQTVEISGAQASRVIRDLRIPNSLIESILIEARENGADPDPDFGDIPAFREILEELRTDALTSSGDTFSDLETFAPDGTHKIYFVAGMAAALEHLEAARGGLVDAQGRLVDAQKVGKSLDSISDTLHEQN